MNRKFFNEKNLLIISIILYSVLILISGYILKKDINILFLILIMISIITRVLLNVKSKSLIKILLLYNLIVGVIIDICGVYELVLFNDLILLILTIKLALNGKINIKNINKVNNVILFIFMSLVFSIIGSVIFKSRLLSAIYQIYTYYKYYYIFMINIVLEWNEIEVKSIVKYIYLIVILQTPMVLLQYFRGAIHADYITGTFGAGGTGILMLYQLFIIGIIVAKYKTKEINIFKFILLMIWILIPSIISEIKMTWLLLPIICIVILLISKINIKTVIIIFLTIIFSVYGIKYMLKIYPEFNYMFENRENFTWYLTEMNYGENSLNRFSTIPYFNENVLQTPIEKAFGIGVGNGLAKNSQLISGKFYQQNSNLKYEYFFLPYLYLETGIIGSGIYILILILLAIKIYKYKPITTFVKQLNNTIVAFIIVNIICTMYNQALYIEQFSMFFWSIIGITININRKDKNYEENSDSNIKFRWGWSRESFNKFIK